MICAKPSSSVQFRFTFAALCGGALALFAVASCSQAPPAAGGPSSMGTTPRPDSGTPPPPLFDAGHADGAACVMCSGVCVDVKSDLNNCGGCAHICASAGPEHSGASCTLGTCGYKCHDGYDLSGSLCVRSIGAPRPLAPLSSSRVGPRPTLRWQLPVTTDGAELELCPTRACDHGLQTFEVSGDRFDVPTDLSAGVHFWRVRGRAARDVGTRVSATWEFFVGRGTAASSWGTVGDFNGDGYADALVADPGQGKVYVYWGGPNGVSATDPTRAVIAVPGGAGSFNISSAGDIDGDGFPDLAIGVDSANKVYIYKGGINGLASTPSYTLSSPYNPTTEGHDVRFGASVASAGDQNGDGYADLIVGTCGEERVLVYSGGATGVIDPQRVELASPAAASAGFGCAVAGAGDIDGDGYTDLVVGAPKANSGAGAVYFYRGGPAEISKTPTLSVPGPDVAQGGFGQALAIAGDIDGDGFADLIVGAPASNLGAGRAYVLHGGMAGLPLEPTVAIDGPDGKGAQFGALVVALGDVDGDGYDDVAISAPSVSAINPLGRVHIYRGGGTGISSTAALALTGPDGGGFGASIAAGDFDGDGFVDMLIGTMTANRAYVYRGGLSGTASSPGVVLVGDSTSTSFGRSVAAPHLR